MRYVTFVVSPPTEGLHPVDRRLVDHPDVEPVAIHHLELLDDGTIVLLGEIRGDPDRYREILETTEAVLECIVSGTDGGAMGFSHVVADDLTLSLFEHRRTSSFVVEMPVTWTGDGRQRYTVVGPPGAFDGGIAVPDGLDVEIEAVGDYRPDTGTLFASLTAREREVLRSAREAGYYEVPREATHADVGADLGISASAAGRHLRRIESKVFAEFQ